MKRANRPVRWMVFSAALVLLAPPGAAQHEGHGGHIVDAGPAASASPAAPSARPAPAPSARPAPKPSAAPLEEARAPIDVPAVQQSRIGLATAKVEQRQVAPTLRAVAVVQVDERREAHVHTRLPGWIDEIYVAAVGQPVKKGQTLYRLYSPDIVSTQQEYLAARGQGEIGKKIAKAALDRLAQWGMSPAEIEALRESGVAKRSLAVASPASGVVVEKMAVQGIYATPDMHLYRIADLSRVWVVASLYETEIGLVKTGDAVDVELPSAPGQVLRSTVSYVYPEIDVATRTGKARIEIDNADGVLKPGMYATVTLKKDLGLVVVVPVDAIIDTGVRKLVFVKTAPTRFEPRGVVFGPRVGEGFVVTSGIAPGDEVVVRASFLIDAESRLQAALKSGAGPQGHAGHGG